MVAVAQASRPKGGTGMTAEAPQIERYSDDDPRLKKDFGTIGLLFTAIGSIIG